MAASRSDSYVLSTDGTFRNRVRAALQVAATNINGEARTVPANFPAWSVQDYYAKRANLAERINNSPDTYAPLMANLVATDATVLADATAAGTVVLAAGNVAAQAALVTDAHIDTAIAGQFNTLVPLA